MSPVVPIRKIPVLFLSMPEEDREPLGLVAHTTDENLSWGQAVDDAEHGLRQAALHKYGADVTIVCNVTLQKEMNDLCYAWRYLATGDVYGKIHG